VTVEPIASPETGPELPGSTGRRIRQVLLGLVAGLIVGGAIGAGYGSTVATTKQATATLQVLPDAAVTTDASGSRSSSSPYTDATAFVQSELVVLNGDQLRQQVRQRLGLAATPKVSAAQVGTTYVVNVTATAPTTTQALRIANTTAAIYSGNRQQTLTNEVNSALATLTKQLNDTRASLAAAAPGQQSALQSEYARLLASSSQLQVSQSLVTGAVSVLQPATPTPTGFSPLVRDGAIGALLGALIGLAFPLLRPRFTAKMRQASDLRPLGVPVLLPELPRAKTDLRTAARTGSVASAARLLAAQLQRTRTAGGVREPLVLLGSSACVGTTYVSSLIAAQMAQSGPVLLVLTNLGPADAEVLQSLEIPAGARSVGDVLTGETLTAAEIRDLSLTCRLTGVRVLLVDTTGRADLRRLAQAVYAGLLPACLGTGWSVVIDAPPLAESLTGAELARQAGGAALVTGRGVTRKVDVVTALEVLEVQRIPLLGTIVNRPTKKSPPASSGRRRADSDGPAPVGPGEVSRDGNRVPVGGAVPQ
jgi:Mrp family chromosome partitioning ATPase/capsular polysaccharide biosynthesis protein